MDEHERELDQAVETLTAEILKLSPLEGQAREDLHVTIQNAVTRLVLAIISKTLAEHENAPPA